MNSIYLQSEVTVQDRDFWGRRSKMTLSPGREGHGWLWITRTGSVVPLNYGNVEKGSRQIQFSCNGSVLHIFEHIGWLKWMGLMDVVLESNPWPPYFGRGIELSEAIAGKCVEGREIKWYTVSKPIKYRRPGANIEILPWDIKMLRINVMVSYPGIGTDFNSFSFPDDSSLRRISSAFTQGWPPRLFYLSRIASWFGWPNHKRINWPQEHRPKELLGRFSAHRALDLLGDLSVICENGLFAADITSVCCGHKDDLVILPQIAEKLQPL